jgi:hypothetical protein
MDRPSAAQSRFGVAVITHEELRDMLAKSPTSHKTLNGFNRTAVAQASENLIQALRVLEMVPFSQTDLLPHPLIVVRAEIENARMLLRLHGAEHSKRQRRSASPGMLQA